MYNIFWIIWAHSLIQQKLNRKISLFVWKYSINVCFFTHDGHKLSSRDRIPWNVYWFQMLIASVITLLNGATILNSQQKKLVGVIKMQNVEGRLCTQYIHRRMSLEAGWEANIYVVHEFIHIQCMHMSRLNIGQGPSNVLVKKKKGNGEEKDARVQTNEKDNALSLAKSFGVFA